MSAVIWLRYCIPTDKRWASDPGECHSRGNNLALGVEPKIIARFIAPFQHKLSELIPLIDRFWQPTTIIIIESSRLGVVDEFTEMLWKLIDCNSFLGNAKLPYLDQTRLYTELLLKVLWEFHVIDSMVSFIPYWGSRQFFSHKVRKNPIHVEIDD